MGGIVEFFEGNYLVVYGGFYWGDVGVGGDVIYQYGVGVVFVEVVVEFGIVQLQVVVQDIEQGGIGGDIEVQGLIVDGQGKGIVYGGFFLCWWYGCLLGGYFVSCVWQYVVMWEFVCI